MAVASAPGKLILFGEHFVVYGLPAIATAIDSRTTADVRRADEYALVDDRPETPGYKKEKLAQQKDSVQRILRAMNLAGANVRITLGGELVAASGVGASGASCSAIAAALNEEFGLRLDREKINAVAYEGEKGYHGTPSGIDNSCSTFGGFIWFERDLMSGSGEIRSLDMKIPMTIVMGNTGVTSNTTEVVEEVRKEREKNPEKFGGVFEDYRRIAEEAREVLERKDLNSIGRLMNRNHELLKRIDLSSPDLEKLVEIALSNGAMGAKLTGTGRGGLMIAFVDDETKDEVASAMEKAGYDSKITTIGAEGVQIEKEP